MAKKKVQFTIDEKAERNIVYIQESMGLPSKADVLMKAVALLRLCEDERKAGKDLFIRSRNNPVIEKRVDLKPNAVAQGRFCSGARERVTEKTSLAATC